MGIPFQSPSSDLMPLDSSNCSMVFGNELNSNFSTSLGTILANEIDPYGVKSFKSTKAMTLDNSIAENFMRRLHSRFDCSVQLQARYPLVSGCSLRSRAHFPSRNYSHSPCNM